MDCLYDVTLSMSTYIAKTSTYIAKTTHLKKPKRVIIWNRGSNIQQPENVKNEHGQNSYETFNWVILCEQLNT